MEFTFRLRLLSRRNSSGSYPFEFVSETARGPDPPGIEEHALRGDGGKVRFVAEVPNRHQVTIPLFDITGGGPLKASCG